MKYCEHCGKPLSDNSLFCGNCGQRTGAAPVQSPEQKHKKGKEKKSKLKIVLICIAIFVSVIGVGLGGIIFYVKKTMDEHRELTSPAQLNINDVPHELIPEDIRIKNDEELRQYFAELDNIASDIDGWSQYDKYKAGLNMEDGSDTDGDGLTDKEELEVYGSDPKKMSTAGDLYTDGEKVQSGIDPSKRVAYDGATSVRDESGAITLYLSTPHDFYANVSDYTEYFKEGKFSGIRQSPPQFYLAYSIASYDNDHFDVNLDAVASLTGKDARDLDVKAYSNQYYESKTKRSRNVVTVSFKDVESFDSGVGLKGYDVFIVDKKSMIDRAKEAIVGEEEPIREYYDGSVLSEEDYSSEYSGLIVCNAWNVCFLQEEPLVYCSTEATPYERDALISTANKLYASVFFKPISVPRPKIDENHIVYESPEEIERLTKEYDRLLGKAYISTETLDRERLMVYQYCPSSAYLPVYQAEQEEIAEEKEKELEEKKKREAKFRLADEFSFANFDTDLLTAEIGGVCSGLAQITAEVYNTGAVKHPNGSARCEVEVDEETITRVEEYDISEIDGLSTFFDRYISDFRPFADNFMASNLGSLARDELEFLRMVVCYWKNTNDGFQQSVDYKDMLLTNKPGFILSWETAEAATRYLDQNQILLCSLNINNLYNSGHTVNLVSYTRDQLPLVENSNKMYDAIIFDVYDSNYPQGFLKLICYKVDTTDGRYALLFKYNTDNPSYFASFIGQNVEIVENEEIGEKEGSTCIKFAIFDDNQNCLNVKL